MSVSTVMPAILAALKAKVEAVTGIAGVAPVYDYWRHVTDEKELRDIFMGGSQARLHWWCVTPAGADTLSIWHLSGCDQANPARFDLHGFYAVKDADASEKAFHTIVWALLDALLADKSLTGSAVPLIGQLPLPVWAENDHRMLVGTLLHHARIAVAVKAEL